MHRVSKRIYRHFCVKNLITLFFLKQILAVFRYDHSAKYVKILYKSKH